VERLRKMRKYLSQDKPEYLNRYIDGPDGWGSTPDRGKRWSLNSEPPE
jgi:hypothetical protein